MPEQQMDIINLLAKLEDCKQATKRSHIIELIHQTLIKHDGDLSAEIIERLSAVCLHDLLKVPSQVTIFLNIIKAILSKVQGEKFVAVLLPTAKAILNILKSVVEKAACLNTLMDYPDTVIKTAACDCDNIIEVFELGGDQNEPLDVRKQVLSFLHRLLSILPPDKKTAFVRKGLPVWFSKLMVRPSLMDFFYTSSVSAPELLKVVEAIEMLTEELVKIDYSYNPHWETILESIYSPNLYPLEMKKLLSSNSPYWHRLWIIFIKLLKTQITMNKPGVGSPINSMLPVVEMAFKLDVTNRCRAFQCWNVLIDNFSAETNELFVNKRIKLLIIPLRSNNAKVEETALAKLDTWWHLIKQYETRMDDRILYPFLHFCFGRHVPEKIALIPGLISPNVKRNCVKAFAELVGHVDCEGCGIEPRLNGRLISTKVLVNFWSDWIHSLKMSLKISTDEEVGLGKQPITCAWKSIVMTIAELPENNIRKDLFNELLDIIKQTNESVLPHSLANTTHIVDIVINILITPLFEEDMIKPLLKDKEWENSPLHQILSILTGSTFQEACKNVDSEKIQKLMKMIVSFNMNECPYNVDKIIEWLLKDSSPTNGALHLWTALAETLQEQKETRLLCKMMTWPLKHLNKFSNVDLSVPTWCATYIRLNHVLSKTAVEMKIKMLTHKDNSANAICFMICALIAIINCKASKVTYHQTAKKNQELRNDLKMFHYDLCKVRDYKPLKLVYPTFIHTLSFLKSIDDLETIMLIVKRVLSILNDELKTNYTHDTEKMVLSLINAILPLYQTTPKEGLEFKALIEDEILKFQSLSSSSEHPNLKQIIKLIMCNKVTNHAVVENNKVTTESFEVIPKNDENNVENKVHNTERTGESEFMTPVPKSTKKTTKKKETSIVNTVVENGEEFAVIKSNWKFNPRKLTENQKEKLQRKREDIPALYQDLSQSQDEFKLKSWKPDSQDASTTNSKSATTSSTEDVSTILKDLPGTNIVPKIIENFFSESPKADTLDKTKVPETVSPKINKNEKAKASPKTPRMALKDRVFRNVRNLIEKSTISKEGTQKLDLFNQTVNLNTSSVHTPDAKCTKMKNTVHSAPSIINADRPSRVKRKPKKYDDSEIYLLKKRRNSDIQNESQSPYIVDNSQEMNVQPDCNSIVPTDVITSHKAVESTIENNKSEINEDSEVSAPVVEPEVIPAVNNPDVDKVILVENKVAEDMVLPEKETEEKTEENLKSNSEDVLKITVSDTSTDTSMDDQAQPEKAKQNSTKENKATPKATKGKNSDDAKSSSKKKSRIEKELAIDMVEGHPFLQLQTDKRVTRKCLSNTPNGTRRKNLTEKLNRSKTDPKNTPKSKKESPKEKSDKTSKDVSITVLETQDVAADLSEDIIESSQDSMSTISVKSFTNSTKKSVTVENAVTVEESCNMVHNCTQDIDTTTHMTMSQENRDDTDIPANKTDVQVNVSNNLTEEMDTEPINENCTNSAVIIINDDDPVIVLNSEDSAPGPDTLEIANADTQPTDPSQFVDSSNVQSESSKNDTKRNDEAENEPEPESSQIQNDADDRTITLTDITQNDENDNASSPFKDDSQRKKDFMNNTQEISPIKVLSPIETNVPSPETSSSDFIVVKLSGPVQMNGEPLEMSHSPEIFTEEKTSPDKRNQSPPRAEVTANNNCSPSSSLSLKKNRPQVRSGGRAAQMLGLCVPDRMQAIMNIERSETDELKKSGPVNTTARRNLRMLYNTAVENENSDENEDSENFLKFKKTLPTATCSPSGPILKRKLADIADEATVSPANKRKRVSFHDPVSTSVSVQKYIESSGVRSPQSSALKRLERQLRSHTPMKSSKRLENLFKLDSILTKAVESFSDNNVSSNESQLTSLEQTPAVEIVKTSDLNDKDPIYPDLIDCTDSIQTIAAELSSPTMKLLLVKELEGKIETVGDLAKLTELEVNRLCIKAPKIQVVRKVLDDYSIKRSKIVNKENAVDSTMDVEPIAVTCNVEVQTSCSTSETETQTSLILQRLTSTQTDKVDTAQKATQSVESGSKSTEDIIRSCIEERKDFVQKLGLQLEVASKRTLAQDLPFQDCIDLLLKKITSGEVKDVINQVLQRESELSTNGQSGNKELSFLQNYLCNKFDSKDLILFCSKILQAVHEKSV